MSSRPTDTVATLLPPQATTLERDLEQSTARVADIPVPEGDIWNADTCPAPLLGWLAWAVSADEWDPAWPEDVKRATIKIAPLLHQRKGTLWAVQNALKPLGTDTSIEEWWSTTPPGVPGTFIATTRLNRTDIAGADTPLLTPTMAAKLRKVISYNKPVSRGFGLRVGLTVTVRERSAAVLRPAQNTRMTMQARTAHLVCATHRECAALRPAARITLQMKTTP